MNTTTPTGKRSVRAVAAVAIAGLALAAAGAQARGWFEREHAADRMADALTRHLELDAAQATSVQDILEGGLQRLEERHAEAKATATAALTADTLSPAQAGELIELRRAMHAARDTELAAVLSEVHAVLTPAQRAELAEMVADRRFARAHLGFGDGDGHRGKRGKRGHKWGWFGHDDHDDDHHGGKGDRH